METIERIFEYLDGKSGVVSSGGLAVEGSMEGRCTFSYDKCWGLTCSDTLQYNNEELVNHTERFIRDISPDLGFSYGLTNNLVESLTTFLNQHPVKLAQIYSHKISCMECRYTKDNRLYQVKLTYDRNEEMNTITISNIR